VPPLTATYQTAAAAASTDRGVAARSDCRPLSGGGRPLAVRQGPHAGDKARRPKTRPASPAVCKCHLHFHLLPRLACWHAVSTLWASPAVSRQRPGLRFHWPRRPLRPPPLAPPACHSVHLSPLAQWSHWLCSTPPASRRTASVSCTGPPHSPRSFPLPGRPVRTRREVGGQGGAPE